MPYISDDQLRQLKRYAEGITDMLGKLSVQPASDPLNRIHELNRGIIQILQDVQRAGGKGSTL